MAQRISPEEYNNADYTRQALKELNEQMKEFKFKPSSKHHRDPTPVIDSCFEDSCSDNEYCEKQRVHASKRKQKLHIDSSSTLDRLACHVDNLRDCLHRKSNELDAVEIRLHQTRLELSNTQVDLENSTERIQKMKNENAKLTDAVFICKVKLGLSIALNFTLAYFAVSNVF